MTTPVINRPHRIASVTVDQLFGQYSYQLPQSGSLAEAAILYGDNGSGKTTLLQLIFHMLSPAGNKGHRGAIISIPFRTLSIKFTDGTTISAQRAEATDGPYRLSFERDGKNIATWNYVPTQGTTAERLRITTDGRARIMRPDKEGESLFLTALQSLNVSTYFLSADRQIQNDDIAESEEPVFRSYEYGRTQRETMAEMRNHALNQALSAAYQWIARRAMEGTNAGTDSANSIYTEIVRRISMGYEDAGQTEVHAASISKTLSELSDLSDGYARFGFIAPFKVEQIKETLQRVSAKTTLALIASVLEPYINGTRARLDALRQIYGVTDTFVRTINDFYVDKSLIFGATRGLRIMNTKNQSLEPRQLSSGEQQLLLLFCHTLVSKEKPSIFIIDEPELSLNIKWQRKLIRSLLDVVGDSQIQFLFASHSIELLAQHEDKVVTLSTKRGRQ